MGKSGYFCDLTLRSTMKKSLLALIVFAAFTLASCASYTCPTYGKAAPAKTKPAAAQTTKI